MPAPWETLSFPWKELECGLWDTLQGESAWVSAFLSLYPGGLMVLWAVLANHFR